ncbi:MAG: substrate-binding domain-containing protein [Phycisphaerales bacterium]|nr:MAG: substrate-binding domain-containing protein [Phycisphaerales bacterium]
MIRPLMLSLAFGVALGLSGCGRETGGGEATPPEAAGGAESRRTVAVIPKGTTHVFWKAVQAGAEKAGEDLGVETIWKGPLKENDRAQQIQVVQQFIAQNVDGIVLAPLDSRALLGPVREAADRNIPVVIFDSALEGNAGEDFVSFVATDNRAGGRTAGEHLAALLEGKGKVVLFRYLAGSASTTNREEGFLEAIAQHPDIEVIVENRFAGPTAGEAQASALNMIDKLRQADGIFASNESATNGMLQALTKEKLAGQVKFVGFDASPPLIEGLESGAIHGLIVQNPRRMGYLAVTTLIQHLNGEDVEQIIDTGAALVTLENMNDPEIKVLID